MSSPSTSRSTSLSVFFDVQERQPPAGRFGVVDPEQHPNGQQALEVRVAQIAGVLAGQGGRGVVFAAVTDQFGQPGPAA